MSSKHHSTEEIVNKPRQADVELAKGLTISAVSVFIMNHAAYQE